MDSTQRIFGYGIQQVTFVIIQTIGIYRAIRSYSIIVLSNHKSRFARTIVIQNNIALTTQTTQRIESVEICLIWIFGHRDFGFANNVELIIVLCDYQRVIFIHNGILIHRCTRHKVWFFVLRSEVVDIRTILDHEDREQVVQCRQIGIWYFEGVLQFGCIGRSVGCFGIDIKVLHACGIRAIAFENHSIVLAILAYILGCYHVARHLAYGLRAGFSFNDAVDTVEIFVHILLGISHHKEHQFVVVIKIEELFSNKSCYLHISYSCNIRVCNIQ